MLSPLERLEDKLHSIRNCILLRLYFIHDRSCYHLLLSFSSNLRLKMLEERDADLAMTSGFDFDQKTSPVTAAAASESQLSLSILTSECPFSFVIDAAINTKKRGSFFSRLFSKSPTTTPEVSVSVAPSPVRASSDLSTENRRSFLFGRSVSAGNLLLIYICNFHFLNHFLLIYICKLHWNFRRQCHRGCRGCRRRRGRWQYRRVDSFFKPSFCPCGRLNETRRSGYCHGYSTWLWEENQSPREPGEKSRWWEG